MGAESRGERPGAAVRVGVISDTHGKLRPEVFRHFEGVAHILHAGDVGPYDLLVELEALAPVTAVYGNTDGWELRSRLPPNAEVTLAGRRIFVTHGDELGSPTPPRLRKAYADVDVVVFGHTHRPLIDREARPLLVNPGGAGAPRFGLPPSIALLTLRPGEEEVELIEL
jgi:putative phosphoesterase